MRIINKYNILEQIGEGSFGTVHKGKHIIKNTLVAIKIEPFINDTKLLINESRIYNYLLQLNCKGVPHIKWFGTDDNNYYMVIDLIGDSIQTIKQQTSHFNITNILLLGIQLIQILKEIHNLGLIHRDIKPDNILLNNDLSQGYLIDYGFCTAFSNKLQFNREQYDNNPTHIIGSLNYASINSHNYLELNKRDDLESLGYIFIFLYFGSLPWDKDTNNNTIKYKKQHLLKQYGEHIPRVIIDYFKYVTYLKFNETPEYDTIIQLFTNN